VFDGVVAVAAAVAGSIVDASGCTGLDVNDAPSVPAASCELSPDAVVAAAAAVDAGLATGCAPSSVGITSDSASFAPVDEASTFSTSTGVAAGAVVLVSSAADDGAAGGVWGAGTAVAAAATTVACSVWSTAARLGLSAELLWPKPPKELVGDCGCMSWCCADPMPAPAVGATAPLTLPLLLLLLLLPAGYSRATLSLGPAAGLLKAPPSPPPDAPGPAAPAAATSASPPVLAPP
jgi:hypothetical protein